MTSLEAIKSALTPDLESLNKLIRAKLDSDNPLMTTVIDSYLSTKGKQIRPIIVMMCARLFGPVGDRVLNAAASVELLHNASLVHDDVVDDSKLRRNTPTINAVWDNRIAVLVGDFFVANALQLAIDTNDLRIIDQIGNLGKMLSLGEIDQIYNARQHSLTEESYFKIINYKTASLFVACARVGCFAANADADNADRLARVAELLGLCFQIRDDIFDYFEDKKVGKPTGNDLREGKVSLPLLYALRTTNNVEMKTLLEKEVLSDDEIAVLIDFARNNGGIDYAYDTMARLRNEAAEIFAQIPQNGEQFTLMDIFDFIIARDF
jgi:octaprenyl-diphosphate synthase